MAPSQNRPRSPAAAQEERALPTATITTQEELTRFAHYVEYRTRNLRNSVQAYLGTNPPQIEPAFNEYDDEDDEELFVDVGRFDDEFADWVAVTNDATELPQDHSTFSTRTHATLPTIPRPTPIGPIQQNSLAARRAALQALGFTGTYLELALRHAAEDVGWLTHTATFEEGMEKCVAGVRRVRERFPVIGRVEESFGRGAGRGAARLRGRRGVRFGDVGVGSSGGGGGDGGGGSSSSATSGEQAAVERLGSEELARFGEVQETPIEDDGEE